MLAFLAGELSNAAMYFSTFADVSSDTMNKLDGTFGFTGKEVWKPWRYETRTNYFRANAIFFYVNPSLDHWSSCTCPHQVHEGKVWAWPWPWSQLHGRVRGQACVHIKV